MRNLFLLQIEHLVGQKGSLAEKQLIQRWRPELAHFFEPAIRPLMNKTLGLEIGIEDTLALKINLKCRELSAAPSLLAFMNRIPAFQPWGNHILTQQLRFHCGIKITPERVSHELYVYPNNHAQFAEQLPDSAFKKAFLTTKPLFMGIDDQRGFSQYFEATDTQWVNHLREELKLPDWQGTVLWPWQQIRFNGERLIAGKTGLELKPLHPLLMARLLKRYPFSYFPYLLPVTHYCNGNFARDPVTGRFALYATVN